MDIFDADVRYIMTRLNCSEAEARLRKGQRAVIKLPDGDIVLMFDVWSEINEKTRLHEPRRGFKVMNGQLWAAYGEDKFDDAVDAFKALEKSRAVEIATKVMEL